jgi:hypothetical protein
MLGLPGPRRPHAVGTELPVPSAEEREKLVVGKRLGNSQYGSDLPPSLVPAQGS